MIILNNKSDCCGCTACVQACPKESINIVTDEEGFDYPEINEDNCIDCGECEKVCPVLIPNEDKMPLHIYAAKNNDEVIRLKSSSGGIFTLLAQNIIKKEGVVFGAKFNDKLEVVHGKAVNEEQLADLRGSKYVQSQLGNTFRELKQYLDKGKYVLFSGTPCQVSGLILFLRKPYEKLITIDFICHGVPSPGIFRYYLTELQKRKKEKIIRVNFRNKIDGWRLFNISYTYNTIHHNVVIENIPKNKDLFFKGFINHIYLRPSCHSCPAKKSTSGSDLKLADFWALYKVNKAFDDDRGCSLLMVNSSWGKNIFSEISDKIEYFEISYIDGTSDPSYNNSVAPHIKRDYFFNEIKNNPDKFIYLLKRLTRPSIGQIVNTFKQNLRLFLVKTINKQKYKKKFNL